MTTDSDDSFLPVLAALSLLKARLDKAGLWDRTCDEVYIAAQQRVRSLMWRRRQEAS